MSLNKYREKRDFSKTPEPAGKKKAGTKAAGRPLSFVVHKHSATHLHYDLRLELDGVLKSWAIPKRPTLDPAEKRLAMMVEDHPLDYGSFEGTIPRGNYGAGTVMIWDAGAYHAVHHEDRKGSEEDLKAGLDKGHISIVLDGKRLKGEYALVKIKRSGDNSWLMIKKHDDFSGPDRGAPEDQDRSAATGRTMEEIVAGNVEAHSVKAPRNIDLHGAPQEAMPTGLKPMLATLVAEPFDKAGWLFEIKWDGYRALAEIHGGKVRILSRNGKLLNHIFPPIAESLQQLPFNALLDGEIVIVDGNGRADFQLLQNYMNTGQGNLVYYVFDILHFRGRNLMDLPLRRRKAILSQVIPHDQTDQTGPLLPHIRLSEHIEDNGTSLFNAAVENNIEGIVAKDGAGPYRPGVRSREWLKVKTAQRQEAVIGGFTAPRGGRKFFGALLLGVYEDGELVYIGRAGGGFTDEGLREMRALMDPLKTDKPPFKEPPRDQAGATWIRPELVCEVRFTQWTSEGLMRHPVFVALREDKGPREVRREIPGTPEEVMPQTKGGRFMIAGNDRRKMEIGGRRLEVTNLQKLFWPEEGYTKGDLIDYYGQIAQTMLPYLRDRLLTMVRYPSGIGREGFFQKDLGGRAPDWVGRARVEKEGGSITYAVCNDAATLVYLANLACIDMHVTLSRTDRLHNPDQMIFDLDPADGGFAPVRKAARRLRAFLSDIGLESFLKTTGSSGLHVMVPLDRSADFDAVRSFARSVAHKLAQMYPNELTVEQRRDKRAGRVYLDVLRNAFGQTAVSAYSVRAHPGAPVSTPIHWEELATRGMDSRRYNIRNIFRRLAEKGDAWAAVPEKAFSLEEPQMRLAEILNEKRTG